MLEQQHFFSIVNTSTISRRRSDRTERIYQSLLVEIISGALQPQQPLVEAELTERFNVSRTPLRAALKRLEEQGLVDIYPQVGSFVAPLRMSDVYDASFIRSHLECAIAKKAAKNITDDFRKQLQRAIKLQKLALSQGLIEDFYQADEDFHLLLATIAGHPNVWRIIEQHKAHLDRVRHYALRSLGKAPSVIRQHENIAQAIIAEQPEEAERAMKEHLQSVHNTLQTWLLSEPEQAHLESAVPMSK